MNLTIADLKSVMQIIDVVVQRGAIRAAEMKVVGEIYDKMREFVETVENQPEQQADPSNAFEQVDTEAKTQPIPKVVEPQDIS
jgi:translation initiation factor IF-2